MLQAQGLALGTLAGTTAHALGFMWIWRRTDWALEARRAEERAEVKLEMMALTKQDSL